MLLCSKPLTGLKTINEHRTLHGQTSKLLKVITKMEYIKVHYVKHWEFARVPTRATLHSVGSDLYSAFDYNIPPGGRAAIDTGIGVIIPLGYYGRLAPRSGLTYKHSLDVGAGVIDPDYTGPIQVILFNFGTEEYLVTKGQSIAQIIYEKVAIPIYEEVQQITPTERGNRGPGVDDLLRESTKQTLKTSPVKHVTFKEN